MSNLLTRLSAIAATTAALSGAMVLDANIPAQAITFNYNFQTDTGYLGTGQFSYDQSTAPTIISESGAGPTKYLESLSLSVFDPANTLLDSGNSVVNGVSGSPYFQFEFNTLTQTLSLFDNSTSASGSDITYFITNFYDPSNNPVTSLGSTTFNLFKSDDITGTATFLGSTASIQVTPVPEPTAVLSLLAIGALGVGSVLKRRQD
jgi:hypothetical protein